MPTKAPRPSSSQGESDSMSSRVKGTSTPAAERSDVLRDKVPPRSQNGSVRVRSNVIIGVSAGASSPYISQRGPGPVGVSTAIAPEIAAEVPLDPYVEYLRARYTGSTADTEPSPTSNRRPGSAAEYIEFLKDEYVKGGKPCDARGWPVKPTYNSPRIAENNPSPIPRAGSQQGSLDLKGLANAIDARLKQYPGEYTSQYLVEPSVQAVVETPKKRPGLHAQYATRMSLDDSTVIQLANMDVLWDMVVDSAEKHQRAVTQYYGAFQTSMALTSSSKMGPVTPAADLMSNTQGAADTVLAHEACHKGQQVQSRRRRPHNRGQSPSKSHDGRDHEGLQTVRGQVRISKPVAPALDHRIARKVRNLRSEDENSAEDATPRGTKHKIESNLQEGIESASEGNRKRSRLTFRDPPHKKDKDHRHITNTSKQQMSRNGESTRNNHEDDATGAQEDFEMIEFHDPASQQGGNQEQVDENERLRSEDLNDSEEWVGTDLWG